MARYGEAFRNMTVARLLPPESANAGAIAKEIGVSVQTLERWREEAQSRPALGRVWTAAARLEAVITAAALDEVGKSAWCREHGVYPAELDKWRLNATTALAEPEEARASPQAAYSTQTGQPVHGKVDSRSVATRGFSFYSESCFWVKLFLRFRMDSPVRIN